MQSVIYLNFFRRMQSGLLFHVIIFIFLSQLSEINSNQEDIINLRKEYIEEDNLLDDVLFAKIFDQRNAFNNLPANYQNILSQCRSLRGCSSALDNVYKHCSKKSPTFKSIKNIKISGKKLEPFLNSKVHGTQMLKRKQCRSNFLCNEALFSFIYNSDNIGMKFLNCNCNQDSICVHIKRYSKNCRYQIKNVGEKYRKAFSFQFNFEFKNEGLKLPSPTVHCPLAVMVCQSDIYCETAFTQVLDNCRSYLDNKSDGFSQFCARSVETLRKLPRGFPIFNCTCAPPNSLEFRKNKEYKSESTEAFGVPCSAFKNKINIINFSRREKAKAMQSNTNLMQNK